MVSEWADGPDRGVLSPCGETSEWDILDHALLQWGHGDASCACGVTG
jgi:hypothetical protein